jgi:uracil DNA glycosylase
MAKTDWNPLLRDQFGEPYWRDLQAFVEHERNVGVVYPPAPEVYAALHLTSTVPARPTGCVSRYGRACASRRR